MIILGLWIFIDTNNIHVINNNNYVINCKGNYYYCDTEDNDLNLYKINMSDYSSEKIFQLENEMIGTITSDANFIYLQNGDSVYKIDTDGNMIEKNTSKQYYDEIYSYNGFIYLSCNDNNIYATENNVFSTPKKVEQDESRKIAAFSLNEISYITVYKFDDFYMIKNRNPAEACTYISLGFPNGKCIGDDDFFIKDNKLYIEFNNYLYSCDLNSLEHQEFKLFDFQDSSDVYTLFPDSDVNNNISCTHYEKGFFSDKYAGSRTYSIEDNYSILETTDSDTIPVTYIDGKTMHYDFEEQKFKLNDKTYNEHSIKLSNFNSDYLFSLCDDKLFVFKCDETESHFLDYLKI